jgi:hypothetical protein
MSVKFSRDKETTGSRKMIVYCSNLHSISDKLSNEGAYAEFALVRGFLSTAAVINDLGDRHKHNGLIIIIVSGGSLIKEGGRTASGSELVTLLTEPATQEDNKHPVSSSVVSLPSPTDIEGSNKKL